MSHTIVRGGLVLDIAKGTAAPADILIEDDINRPRGEARARDFGYVVTNIGRFRREPAFLKCSDRSRSTTPHTVDTNQAI